MRRSILLILGLTLATAGPLCAGTFARQPLAPDLGVDALTRGVARDKVGRDVFSNPYATVTISNVDIYDRFPYLETRRFQIVSDPRWNRLVCSEPGQSLRAFDGKGTPIGELSDPRGMAVDEQNHVFVADAGNDRIVVLRATTEFSRIDLVPLYAIEGLSGPYDVAYSDGGTPFTPGDDFLYVADTGRNRIVAYSVTATGAHVVATLGDLGSGTGHFAGPMAIATGRSDGANSADVYVADAHNGRIVHLRHEHGTLRWVADAVDGAEIVTSLDTDRWGNVYAAAPQQGVVRKFNPSLEPVAELRAGLTRPRAIHVPFSNVFDHRDGSVTRRGEASALSVGQWADDSGVNLWSLGVGIEGLDVVGGDAPVAHFTLTDRAPVTLEITDASTGRLLTRRSTAALTAGVQSIPLVAEDLRGATSTSDLVLRVSAASSYANGQSDVAQASFRSNGGGGVALPAKASLLGNWPNPTHAATRITFALPQSHGEKVTLGVFDASGRRIRMFDEGFAPGLNEVFWDGADENGRAVHPGLYFYRLNVGELSFTRRLVVVR